MEQRNKTVMEGKERRGEGGRATIKDLYLGEEGETQGRRTRIKNRREKARESRKSQRRGGIRTW